MNSKISISAEYTGTDINYKREWDIFFFNRIEEAFPGRFLLIATGLLWGGILAGYSLEDQPWASRVIYSTHVYHFSGFANTTYWDWSFGNTYPPEKLLIEEWGFRVSPCAIRPLKFNLY
jgi:hypothetical protein